MYIYIERKGVLVSLVSKILKTSKFDHPFDEISTVGFVPSFFKLCGWRKTNTHPLKNDTTKHTRYHLHSSTSSSIKERGEERKEDQPTRKKKLQLLQLEASIDH